MKKFLLIIFAFVVITACDKAKVGEESAEMQVQKAKDIFQGFKCSEQNMTLYSDRWKTNAVGNITIGIEDADVPDYNPTKAGKLYVRYETTGNWRLKKTNCYVGDAPKIPRRNRRCGTSKLDRFPHKRDYSNSYKSHAKYYFDNEIDAQGFAVSCQAEVVQVDDNDNATCQKKSWGHRPGIFSPGKRISRRFADGGSGWYSYYKPEAPVTHAFLYGTERRNDSVNIYHINCTNGESTLIYSEAVTTTPATCFNGLAWDSERNRLFFAAYPEGELWSNDLDETDANLVGNLNGSAAGGTFYDGNYYYVDDATNEIFEVALNDNNEIVSENVIGTLDQNMNVQSIAMSPDGLTIYGVDSQDGTDQIFSYNISGQTSSQVADTDNNEVEIAFGSDEELYAIDETGELSTINIENGEIIDVAGVDVDVELSDITTAPEEEVSPPE